MLMDLSSKYEEYVRQFPPLTPARERVLSAAIMGGSGSSRDKAIEELVNSNLRLVLSLAQKYRGYQQHHLDIVFDGNVGLIRAASDFDHRKGAFSTHAIHRIRTAIRAGMRTRLGPVSVPRTDSSVAGRILDMVSQDEEDDAGLAVRLGVRTGDVKAARRMLLAMSEAIPLVDETGRELELPDPRSMEMYERLHRKEMLGLVREAALELGLTDDELSLVSESSRGGTRSRPGPSVVKTLSRKWGVSRQTVEQTRDGLVARIRRRILAKVGSKEYLALSASGKLPKDAKGKARRD